MIEPGLAARVLALAGIVCLLAACKASTPPRHVLNSGRTAATAAAPSAATSATSRPAVPTSVSVAKPGEAGVFTFGAGGVVPQTVAVQSGRSVSWRNADTVPHRAVSDEPGLFDTGEIPPGQQADVDIRAPGYHDWHDPANAALTGTVRVIP